MQFERDNGDPFGVDQMIAEAQKGAAPGPSTGTKRYGIDDPAERQESKRARVDDSD